jgi:hypothetical protein
MLEPTSRPTATDSDRRRTLRVRARAPVGRRALLEPQPKTLQESPSRAQQELALQIGLGVPLMLTKGYAAPEVEKVYSRARELYQQVGESPQLPKPRYAIFPLSLHCPLWRWTLSLPQKQKAASGLLEVVT